MKNYAKLNVVGVVGNIKFAQVGKKKTSKVTFAIGVNKYKKVGENFERLPTLWLNCIAWNDLAREIKNIKKGSIVSAEGNLIQEVLPATERFPKEIKRQTVWIDNIKVLRKSGEKVSDDEDSDGEDDSDEKQGFDF